MILIKNVKIERIFDSKNGELAARCVDYEVETNTGRILIWISKIYHTPGLPESTTRRVICVISHKYGFKSVKVCRGDIQWIKKFDADSAHKWLTKNRG